MGLVPWLMLLAWSPLAAQVDTETGYLQEYFVRQEANEPLVIRVQPFEAEFVVRITGPDGELLRESSLPGNRTLPLYLYLPATDKERQLDVGVVAPWRTSGTRFNVEFYRLDVRDELSTRLARAYQLLSQGQERLLAVSAANWSVRINMLLQSERLFADFGIEEHRLWAALAAAHIAFRELGEADTALEWVNAVMVAARLSGHAEAALAATGMRGEILFSLALDRAGQNDSDLALAALSETAGMSARRGYGYEQAMALFMSGEMYTARDELPLAIERYEQALELALGRDAMELSAEIRKKLVSAHDRLGDVVASEQVLGSMVAQLADAGAQDEWVRGLLIQGQLYIDLFRYPDAIVALRQSLEVDTGSLTRAQASIMLGEALYHSGEFGQAAAVLERALINPQTGVFRRPNPLLPLNRGLQTLANTYRQSGRFDEAKRVRLVQSRHLETPSQGADWALQKVLDEVADRDQRAARRALDEGAAQFRALSDGAQEHIAQLAVCSTFGPGPAPCTDAGVSAAYERAVLSARPRWAVSAGMMRARFLYLSGRRDAASRIYADLLMEVHFYHSRLTGLLGGWYWEHANTLFEHAVQAMSGESPEAAESSFLALVRILAIGRSESRYEGDDALRAALANGEGWRGQLGALSARFAVDTERLEKEAVRGWLGDLGGDEAVVVSLPERERVRSWLADADGVRYFQQRAPEDFGSVLDALRDNETRALKESAGEILLGQVGDLLPRRVYWLPVGAMLGVDFGSLRRNGRPLDADHSVVGLLDFPSGKAVRAAWPAGWPEQVFVAGDPVDWTSTVAERLSISAEMAVVRDQFIGPGLHMIQGNALLSDEFETPRLAASDLTHLALPVTLDLAQPERSSLDLSEPGRGQGRTQVYPSELRQWPLSKGMWVLNQVTYRNRPSGAYQSRIGVVSDLAMSGAGLIVTCRQNDAQANVEFLDSFYRQLRASRSPSEALRGARAAPEPGPECALYAP